MDVPLEHPDNLHTRAGVADTRILVVAASALQLFEGRLVAKRVYVRVCVRACICVRVYVCVWGDEQKEVRTLASQYYKKLKNRLNKLEHNNP